jgi:hypothetical protein
VYELNRWIQRRYRAPQLKVHGNHGD